MAECLMHICYDEFLTNIFNRIMMKLTHLLGSAVLLGASTFAPLALAAAPATAPASTVVTVGHVKAVHALMEAMQAEKMMRTITGMSRYGDEAQRTAAYAKLEKVPAQDIYARLAYPLARTISQETATEMTRFYNTPYGKKVVFAMYNSRGSYGEAGGPVPTAAERKELARPELMKARQEMANADSVIHHEGFVLLQAILNRK
jgi:hypothetical protein